MTDIQEPPLAAPVPRVAPAASPRAEAWAMLRLAGPVIVARAGLVVMLTVDTLMTGMAGAGEIAELGLGLSPVMVFMLATVGLLQGSMVLIAQANGARDYAQCGAVWRVALIHAVLLGSCFALIGLAAMAVLVTLVRRLRDIGHAGVWGLLWLVPVVGAGLVLWLLFLRLAMPV